MGGLEEVAEFRSQEIQRLADGIRERDRSAVLARGNWLYTGTDLREAKTLIPHGKFEPWCDGLGYSKSKAEKLMSAAAVFAPLLESVAVTDFPPPTVAYKLSAPSTPQSIRDVFLPRALRGERVGPELTRALRDRRAVSKKSTAPQDDGSVSAVVGRNPDLARVQAVALLVARVGDAVPLMLELAATAGLNGIFAEEFERQLRATIVRGAQTDGEQDGDPTEPSV